MRLYIYWFVFVRLNLLFYRYDRLECFETCRREFVVYDFIFVLAC